MLRNEQECGASAGRSRNALFPALAAVAVFCVLGAVATRFTPPTTATTPSLTSSSTETTYSAETSYSIESTTQKDPCTTAKSHDCDDDDLVPGNYTIKDSDFYYFDLNCTANYDNTSWYTPEVCGGDYTVCTGWKEAYGNDTATWSFCGDACVHGSSWFVICTYMVWAHAEEACSGSYNPEFYGMRGNGGGYVFNVSDSRYVFNVSDSRRRLGEARPALGPALRGSSTDALLLDESTHRRLDGCGKHAYCDVCDANGTENQYCKDVLNDTSITTEENEFVRAAVIMDEAMGDFCADWGLL